MDNRFFKVAGNLDSGNKFFKRPGDLNEIINKSNPSIKLKFKLLELF